MVQIRQNNNSYYFEVQSDSGGLLLKSVLFSDEPTARKALEAISEAAPKSVIFERRTNHTGKFLFRIKHIDGTIIGESQLYDSEPGMENGIKNLRNCVTKAGQSG